MTTARLPIALRAYTAMAESDKPRFPRKHSGEKWPPHVLIFDTETTTDAVQRFRFGWYRFGRWRGTQLVILEEGIIYADELSGLEPATYGVLHAYARSHEAEAKDRLLKILSRAEFVESRFMEAVCRVGAMIVGFNLPFDLSRLAVSCGEARGRYRGGFSLVLCAYRDKDTGELREHAFRPRISIKHVNRNRSFIQLTRPREVEPDTPMARDPHYRGHFLDLKTIAFALTGRGYSLDRACEAFEVGERKLHTDEHGLSTTDYIDYARGDVRVTTKLLVKVREEFDRHPIDLHPCRAFSPAAIAKAYLGALGIKPPLEKYSSVPRKILGHAMTGYYGGRAEIRIRRTPVPVLYCDFLSMYPTVNTLMGLWRYFIAREIEVVDATSEVREFLETVTAEACFSTATWKQLSGFALVVPDGDVLPVRAQYDESRAYNIGVNFLTSRTASWYALPDLVASKLLTGKSARVLQAFKLIPHGQQPDLAPVRLRGNIEVDPRSADFFRNVIEERKRLASSELPAREEKRLSLFLKILANSGSYGIFAEVNPQELRPGKRREILLFGVDGESLHESSRPETPGPFCFPPIAACITAAARLMLALLEHEVTARGGSYVLCDTDSMAIVSTKEGGLIPCEGGPERMPDGRSAIQALTWRDAHAIVDKFARLNPYAPEAVPGSVLKIEEVNFHEATAEPDQLFAYAISAKRYVLYNMRDGKPYIRKPSEHGLGHLANPLGRDSGVPDWITAFWMQILSEATGQKVESPDWMRRIAVTRTGITSPELLRPFAELNKDKPYADQVKPFNFLQSAHVAPLGHPAGANPVRFHLVAPHENDPERWEELQWLDIYSRRIVPVYTGVGDGNGRTNAARVRTYADVLAFYRTHPEKKSCCAATGEVCSRKTIGYLTRRHVEPIWRDYIGKESNKLEQVNSGLVQQWRSVREVYPDANPVWWQSIRAELHGIPANQLAHALGITPRYVKEIRNGHAFPAPELLAALVAFLSG